MSEGNKVVKLDAYLNDQRQEWTLKIRELAKCFKSVEKLNQAMVEIPSYRQILIEQIAQLNIKIKQQDSSLAKKYKTKFVSYYEYDYKLTDKQKESFIKADMSEDGMVRNLLENSNGVYARNRLRLLDNMSWAVRNKVQINSL